MYNKYKLYLKQNKKQNSFLARNLHYTLIIGILFSSYISKTREKMNIEIAVRKPSSLGVNSKSQQGQKVNV